MSANDILFIVYVIVFAAIGIIGVYANWIRIKLPERDKR